MHTLLVLIFIAGTPPPPNPTGDTVVGLYYAGQAQQATSLVGSAAHTLLIASWRITDGTLCSALALAASRGVAVQVAYDGSAGTNNAQYLATAAIRASGGTVIACNFPHHIANNFVSADADYTITGNYYYSPTAVQIGAYSIAISGTPAAAAAAVTFATITSGGTITAYLAPYIEFLGKRPVDAARHASEPAKQQEQRRHRSPTRPGPDRPAVRPGAAPRVAAKAGQPGGPRRASRVPRERPPGAPGLARPPTLSRPDRTADRSGAAPRVAAPASTAGRGRRVRSLPPRRLRPLEKRPRHRASDSSCPGILPGARRGSCYSRRLVPRLGGAASTRTSRTP